MDISAPLLLCWGLAFFLYGMFVLSAHLKSLANRRLEQALRHITSSRVRSLLLGTGITIALQSSSALTVLLVGLVNSGVMQLRQTIGVIMGSNIGTTLTAWLFSLTQISSDHIIFAFLNLQNICPLLALTGVGLIAVSNRPRSFHAGHMMVGFSILICGMEWMSQATVPLSGRPWFSQWLLSVENPFCGILIGTVFTGIIQSSAASVGILQALTLAHPISFS